MWIFLVIIEKVLCDRALNFHFKLAIAQVIGHDPEWMTFFSSCSYAFAV